MQAYADETREALGGLLRPGNAGSNTAADHKTVVDLALAQIPAEHIENLAILVRPDSAGATHEFADHCYEGNMRFSVGYELTEQVRAAILEIPEDAWVLALDQDGSERENGQVAEITENVDLSSWPDGSRLGLDYLPRIKSVAALTGGRADAIRPGLARCTGGGPDEDSSA